MYQRPIVDFFESQEIARKNTVRLVGYFILAVILIVLAVYVALAFILNSLGFHLSADTAELSKFWDPMLFLVTTSATLLLVLIGSTYKIISLRGGGEAIAETLGCVPVPQDTSDPAERRLLNVVEEMAIASGTPVPTVYLMDEEAINAFAAGFSLDDAVVGVTKGCIDRLNRDELQGVIAHEFSHILNGDMRLNLRLMGILHGILLIGMAGYYLLRSLTYSRGMRSRRDSNSKSGGGIFVLLILGITLLVIGYIGVFFAKLIKSAVSRQREFLADSAAVQFTRNPDGISGALKKIGGFSRRSRLDAPNVEQASHLFFCNALKSSFMKMMSTHPPLSVRIKRIDPSFDDTYPNVSYETPSLQKEELLYVSQLNTEQESETKLKPVELKASTIASQIGAPNPEHLSYAASLRSMLPAEILAATHEPYKARAVIFALLLSRETEQQAPQLKRLEEHTDTSIFRATVKLAKIIQDLPLEFRLPIVDIALPALRTLSLQQYEIFRDIVELLVNADEEVDLFEYTLQRILIRHLDSAFRVVKKTQTLYYSLKPMRRECSIILAVLAYIGHTQENDVAMAFKNGTQFLQIDSSNWHIPSRSECGLIEVDQALNKLILLSPKLKKQLIEACTACVSSDNYVTIYEAELFRAIGEYLGCPVPPFLGRQQL